MFSNWRFYAGKKRQCAFQGSEQKEAAPEKISTFLGLGCLGLGASCIPSILGSILHNNWLHLLSIVLVVLVIGAATVYERKGKIK